MIFFHHLNESFLRKLAKTFSEPRPKSHKDLEFKVSSVFFQSQKIGP